MVEQTSINVAVVGAGLAGLAAALRAAQAGLSVAVLEKSREAAYPCNSRFTGGLFHIAMDDMAGERDWTLRNVVEATYGQTHMELAQALVDTAPRTLTWLREQGVRMIKGGPDGLRNHALAPPGIQQTGLNPNGRPYWVGRSGDVMLRTLTERFTARGGVLRRGVRARRLLMENDRCIGLEAEEAGKTISVRADAVVLADGGFQANEELMKRFISRRPERLMQRNARSGGGDCLLMAEEAGAALVGTESFYGHLLYREAMEDDRFWPYPMLDSVACGGVVVDASARRFCDEGRGGIYVANEIARLDDPLSTFAIFDSAIWNEGPARDFLLPANPNFTKAGGVLRSADSVAGLAALVGLDPVALSETVEAHNRFVENGAKNPLAMPRTTSKRQAWPIVRPPFHAIPLCAGVTYTMGGILTDPDGRVLRPDRAPIPGVFAAGACTGGLEGWSDAGYSGGLSKASVFGMRTGEYIARSLAEPA